MEKPRTEPVGLKTYLLIRIGLDVEEGRWFDKRLEQRPGQNLLDHAGIPVEVWGSTDRREESRVGRQTGQAGQLPAAAAEHGLETEGSCGPGRHPYGIWDMLGHPWKTIRLKRVEHRQRRRERARRLAQEQEQARLAVEREQLLGQVEEAMKRLALEVAELSGDIGSCLCVYEDNLRKALVAERELAGNRLQGDWEQWEESRDSGRQDALGHEWGLQDSAAQERENTEMTLPLLWQKHFPVAEFHGYTQQFWVEQVFTQAMRSQLPPHFVILGTAPGLPQILEAHVRRMKSLRWFLPSAEWNEELSVFVEDFYTEYGLAIELQLVEDEAALKRLRPFSRESVNIVDFTGENFMAVSAAPEGSVWLDMYSVEEKRRRILAKGKKITYFSMKEIWKNAQKRCNCPLLP